MAFDLDAYFARIGCSGSSEPTAETLREVHLAHVLAIPFENLSIQIGHGISLDPADLSDKLITHKRGGYCFESNGLLCLALEALGYDFDRLAGRVWEGGDGTPPAAHQAMRVRCDGRSWLADVGFGARGLRTPLPLEFDRHDVQHGETYRLRRDDEFGTMLQWLHPGTGWQDLYSFHDQCYLAIDYKYPNYYLSTSPDSSFVKHLGCCASTLSQRKTIRDDMYRVHDIDGTVHQRRIADRVELLALLAHEFGIDLPADTELTVSRRKHAP